MMIPAFARRIAVAGAAVLLLASSPAAAQLYGPNAQILAIDATSFGGFGARLNYENDGYVKNTDVQDLILYAPIALPNGAVVTNICLYARNEEPSKVVQLSLQMVKLVVSGQSPPGAVTVPGADLVTGFHAGYGESCTGTISHEVHETMDADGDQIPELVTYRLRVSLPLGNLKLGGARITWHRQVSPPPAVATFPDVPTSHPFFQYVEALSAAGITAGYGNGFFGVNDPISRGQMAVFLAKALGLHWSN